MPQITLNHNCPHCGERIDLAVNVHVGEAQAIDRHQRWWDALSQDKQALIVAAEKAGLLHALQTAVGAVMPHEPKNMRRFLFNYFACAGKFGISPAARLAIGQHFGSENITAVQHLHIVAIFIEDVLRLFVPASHLQPVAITQNGKGIKVAELSESIREFNDWVRTKRGYVPKEAAIFAQQLQQRSFGAYDNVRD